VAQGRRLRPDLGRTPSARFDMSSPANQRSSTSSRNSRNWLTRPASAHRLAIAFVINHPAVTAAIMAAHLEQLESQLPAAEVT